MNLNLIFLMLDETPHKLLFVCPCCQKQNHLRARRELSQLFCNGCGIAIDASHAELEILSCRGQQGAANAYALRIG